MADKDFIAQLRGYSLTTAEFSTTCPITLPSCKPYIWQDYDPPPRFVSCCIWWSSGTAIWTGRWPASGYRVKSLSIRPSSGMLAGGSSFTRALPRPLKKEMATCKKIKGWYIRPVYRAGVRLDV